MEEVVQFFFLCSKRGKPKYRERRDRRERSEKEAVLIAN